MTTLLLIAALLLILIGVDIYRFPKLRRLTRHEQGKYIFGDRPFSEGERDWMKRHTYFASGNAMRYLAAILIAVGLCLAARALAII